MQELAKGGCFSWRDVDPSFLEKLILAKRKKNPTIAKLTCDLGDIYFFFFFLCPSGDISADFDFQRAALSLL